MADADSLLNAYDDAQANQEIQARYALAIALWDDTHNRDRRGYLPEQCARWRQYVAAIDSELNLARAAFWRWLVEHERVTR